MGVLLLLTFAISIAGIIQRNHVNIGLVILNYALLVDAFAVVVIGTHVWWYTLGERANFHALWLSASTNSRIALQDQVSVLPFSSYFLSSMPHLVQMLWLLQ